MSALPFPGAAATAAGADAVKRPKVTIKKKVGFASDPAATQAAADQAAKQKTMRRVVNTLIERGPERVRTRIETRKARKQKKEHIMTQEEREEVRAHYRALKNQRKQRDKDFKVNKREAKLKRKQDEAFADDVAHVLKVDEPSAKRRRTE